MSLPVYRDAAVNNPAMCYAPLMKTIALPTVYDPPAFLPASPAHYPTHAHAARAPAQTATPPPEVDLCYAPRVRAIQLPPVGGCRDCPSRGSPVATRYESDVLGLQFYEPLVNSPPSSRIHAPRPGRPVPGSILYYGHGFDDLHSQQQPHQFQNTVPTTTPPFHQIDLLPPHIMFGPKHLPPAYASPPASPSSSSSSRTRTRTPSDPRAFRPR